MIYHIPPLPFPAIDPDRIAGARGSVSGRGNDFLDVLARTMAEIEGVQAPRPSPLDPTMLPPHLMSPARMEPKAEENPMKEVIRFVLKQEGSTYVARDGGKESSKYGVLQSTARGYGFRGNIKHLTREDAEAIYEKMWKESGAERLPRSLAIVHFDTYINSPAAARRMLKASGGDTDTYLDLRAERYARLATRRPERYAKYAKGWMNRVERLRTMVVQNNNTLLEDTAT